MYGDDRRDSDEEWESTDEGASASGDDSQLIPIESEKVELFIICRIYSQPGLRVKFARPFPSTKQRQLGMMLPEFYLHPQGVLSLIYGQ
jgi:hypothetical protein